MNEARIRREIVVDEIRQQVVKEYLSTDVSLRTLAIKYKYDHNLIYRWVMSHQRSKKGNMLNGRGVVTPAQAETMSTDVKQLQEELRRARIEILLLQATIDVADEQLGTNIRKKAGTRRS